MFPDTFPLINIFRKVIYFHSTLPAAPTFFPSRPSVQGAGGDSQRLQPQPWGPSAPKTHPAVPFPGPSLPALPGDVSARAIVFSRKQVWPPL